MSRFAPRALRFALFAVAAAAHAAEPAKIQFTVLGVPVDTAEVVVVFDAGAAPAANYDDPAPPPPAAAAPAAAVPADQPNAVPGQGARRRRFGGGNASVALPAPTRAAIAAMGQPSVTLTANVPPADNYQARVVALGRGDPFPAVLASGRLAALKFAAGETMPLQVTLRAPEVKLAPTNPATVTPGAHYRLSGTITDAAHALGTKNRMRIWISEGVAPTQNFSGTQTSTIDVTASGDDVAFTFELVAPSRATTLYYQVGELPPDFTRPDGRQAAFVVLPDLSSGAKPLALRVQ
jgi:hypothetical protein